MTTISNLPSTTPEDVGMSSKRLQRINTHMQSYVEQNKLAGVITAVCRKNKLAHFACTGTMDLETPLQSDTLFRIYSMSKPITTVAALMLYEEGLFQLNDPISKFIPEFENTKVFTLPNAKPAELDRPITIRDLMTHTSGLTYGPWLYENSPVDDLYGQLNPLLKNRTLKEMISELAQLPLVTSPGIAWRYSVSTDVLGYLIEVLSNTDLRTFFKKRIFDPLSMTDTDFHVPTDKHNRFATNFGPSENGIQVIDAPTTGEYSAPPQFYSGGGGLVSTASDYLQFTHLLLNNGMWHNTCLLGKKTVELMTTNHLAPHLLPIKLGNNLIPGYGFGLGVAVLTDVAQSENLGSVGEYRWGGAATTAFWIDPQEELIGLLLTQFMPAGHYPIRNEFKTLVDQAIIA